LYSGYAASAAVAAEVKIQNGGPLDRRIKRQKGRVTEHFTSIRKFNRQLNCISTVIFLPGIFTLDGGWQS